MKPVITPVSLLAIAIFASLGLAASIAFAQGQGDNGQERQEQASLETLAYSKPGDLQGTEVVDGQENQIGEVEDVVVSRRDGGFYLVISSDEFLGLGDEDLAVAVNDLQGNRDRLVVRSQEALVPFVKEEFLRLQEP